MSTEQQAARDHAVTVRGRWRFEVGKLSQAQKAFLSAAKTFMTTRTSSAAENMESAHLKFEEAGKALSEQVEITLKSEKELSLIDLRLNDGHQTTEPYHKDRNEFQNEMKQKRNRQFGRSIPEPVQELWAAIARLKLLKEDLRSDLPEREAAESAERQRLDDQGHELQESDEAFESRFTGLYADAEAAVRVSEERVNELRADCESQGFETDSIAYAPSGESDADSGVRKWLEDTNAEPYIAHDTSSRVGSDAASDCPSQPPSEDIRADERSIYGSSTTSSLRYAAKTFTPASSVSGQGPRLDIFGGPWSKSLTISETSRIRNRPGFRTLREIMSGLQPTSDLTTFPQQTNAQQSLKKLDRIVTLIESMDLESGLSQAEAWPNKEGNYLRMEAYSPTQQSSISTTFTQSQDLISTSPPSFVSIYGHNHQYRPLYHNPQEQQPSWQYQHSGNTDGARGYFGYGPPTPQSIITPSPRGSYDVSSETGRSTAIGPHMYQNSVSQSTAMWPVTTIPHTQASRTRQVQFGQPTFGSRAGAESNDSGVTKSLYNTFKQPTKPKRFFRVGRVFMVLWTEPLGDERLSETSQFTLKGLHGDWLHQKVRRFIVIGEAGRHSLAIPIITYGNKGVSKQGLDKSDHGIIYIGSKPPEPDNDELPARGESPMVPIPIRVDPDQPTEKLGLKARIHYNKVYTIEHNVKARSIDEVGLVAKREWSW